MGRRWEGGGGGGNGEGVGHRGSDMYMCFLVGDSQTEEKLEPVTHPPRKKYLGRKSPRWPYSACVCVCVCLYLVAAPPGHHQAVCVCGKMYASIFNHSRERIMR